MLGGTLALLSHSLQLDGRLLRHHLYRLSFVGILYLFVLGATFQAMLVGAPGQWLFLWIAYLNFWFITLAAISYFATAISEEKEEETIGILRMAGISPAGLLLGKSTSRLIIAALLLGLQFPFALLAITLGGVTRLQVFSVFLGLMAYTALAANLALLCSVIARRASRASFMMTLLLALFFFFPLVVGALLGAFSNAPISIGNFDVAQIAGDLADDAISMSVFNRLSIIMATSFDESPLSFQVTSNFVLGILFFIVSRMIFDRVTRYHATPTSGRSWMLRPTGRWKFLGPGRAWMSALVWKDFQFITGGKPVMILKLIGYGLVVALGAMVAFSSGTQNPFALLAIWTISPMAVMLLVESTLMAARVFREEIQLNAMPSLMLLPHSPHVVAYLKVAGCLIGLIPVVMYLAIGLGCAVAAIAIEPSSEGMIFSVIFAGIGLLTLIGFSAFFVHLVAFMSLVVKWGSIPLSIGIGLVALVMFGCFMWPIASFAFLGLAVGLHFMIGMRWKYLGMQ